MYASDLPPRRLDVVVDAQKSQRCAIEWLDESMRINRRGSIRGALTADGLEWINASVIEKET